MKNILMLSALIITSIILAGCNKELASKTTNPEPMKTSSSQENMKTELKTEIIKEGQGPTAQSGNFVVVHYIGTFENGEKFDSSRDRNEPFNFTLDSGQVIPGWDQGVIGMKVGEIRKLTIPPHLAYGENGIGPIPPNATLTFEIELLEIKDSIL